MKKALWWIAVILLLLGLASFVPDSDMPRGLGVFFLICAVVIGAGLIYHDNKTQKEESNANRLLWERGFPVVCNLPVGHFHGAYDEWKQGFSDSAGGWDVFGAVQNISPYTINYLYLYVYPIDRIGNRVAKTDCWKYTGPYSPGEAKVIISKHNWYDLSVDKVELEKIVVEYATGEIQVTTPAGSCSALLGSGELLNAWKPGVPNADGTWTLMSVVRYQAIKASQHMIITVVPLGASGAELAPAMDLTFRSSDSLNSGQCRDLLWGGLWKNLPVKRVQIKKVTIEFTDGTTQAFIF